MKRFLKIAAFSWISAALFSAAAQVSGGDFSQTVPEAFFGVWERDDRYVAFLSRDAEESEGREAAAIFLKTFYSWHLDRAAEPEFFKGARALNDSTCPDAERIFVEYRPLVTGGGGEEGASVWELFVWFPGLREPRVVPVAVIGGNLYLDFAVKLNGPEEVRQEEENSDEAQKDPMLGFWCKMAGADGIKICPPVSAENIYSSYITEDAVYTIRYWRTDMEYTNERAFFSDGGKTFSVPKHIQSAGKIFTCANGRSVTIRNVQKTNDRPSLRELSGGAGVCGLGEPYLKRVQDNADEAALLSLAETYFARRAPDPDPPFPPSNLDWHLDDIRRLEAGNKIVEEVRKRQKEFAEKYPGPKIY